MKIAFDINDVLRNTYVKASEIYQKFYVDEFQEEKTSVFDEEKEEFIEIDLEDEFKYELNLPIKDKSNLIENFKFKSEDDLNNFFYVDFPMQIFGHAPSLDSKTFQSLNEIYEDLRDDHNLSIISYEVLKSKPASLFFLSKYGCLIETIKFYSNTTFDNIWKDHEIIVTADPEIIKSKPKNKTVIKLGTTYNKDFNADYEISEINDLKDLYNQLKLKK
jgi:hypothetical protein